MSDSLPRYTLATIDATPPMTWGYWVVEGRLLAGAYPGSLDQQEHRRKVQTLLDAGIRTIINLTEPTETGRGGVPFTPYELAVQELSDGCPQEPQCLRFPIPDLSVPTTAVMTAVINAIDDALANNRPVYVHCWGGVGRTGTVVGCWLLRHGLSKPHTVIGALNRLRKQDRERGHRLAPETDEQRRFLRDWPAAI